MNSQCDICMNYYYDEEYDSYMCGVDMDEDEVFSLYSGREKGCPYFQRGDEYTIVRKQI